MISNDKLSLDSHFKHINSSLFNAVGLNKTNQQNRKHNHIVEITSVNLFIGLTVHVHMYLRLSLVYKTRKWR